ncbi:hypothetical protein AMS68_006894 [Peltaster fructicola]|uniref:Uncharacterized protein n=1 Tax=Peltaster fructicola TaxID=286661 RepID=A0A6H0Y302_9PEZI|nr:hypothetical protein AMS68_006894 [Peltaster fructicola]
MADIHAHIANFASKNEELLGVLERTDYAEAALKQQEVYVKDLENELTKLVQQIRTYEQKTKVEKAEFEKYRDSNIKRFAYKLGGTKGKEKFQSRSEKEEKEYYEALEQERGAKDRKDSLDHALKEAVSNRDNYKQDSDTHIGAQTELDNLYNMVFAGPTPSFPQEDQLEWQFTQARERYNNVEQAYRANWQACDIFNEARKRIHLATQYMDEARSASQWDMFGGGAMADMAERNALSRAESEASQVQGLVSQALRVYPDGVKDIPGFHISHGSIMSDMMFDNIFTDMAFHDKIKASQTRILQVQHNVEGQFAGLNQQLAGKKAELDAVQAELGNARKQLQDMRSQIFTQVGSQQPPPYQV